MSKYYAFNKNGPALFPGFAALPGPRYVLEVNDLGGVWCLHFGFYRPHDTAPRRVPELSEVEQRARDGDWVEIEKPDFTLDQADVKLVLKQQPNTMSNLPSNPVAKARRAAVRETLIGLGYRRVSYTDQEPDGSYTETWGVGVETLTLNWGPQPDADPLATKTQS